VHRGQGGQPGNHGGRSRTDATPFVSGGQTHALQPGDPRPPVPHVHVGRMGGVAQDQQPGHQVQPAVDKRQVAVRPGRPGNGPAPRRAHFGGPLRAQAQVEVEEIAESDRASGGKRLSKWDEVIGKYPYLLEMVDAVTLCPTWRKNIIWTGSLPTHHIRVIR